MGKYGQKGKEHCIIGPMKGSLVGRGPPQQEALQSTTAGATWGMCSCHQPTVSGSRPHWQPARSTIVWQTKPWMETCQFKWSRALCILFPQTFNIIITASHLLLSCHLSDRSWGSGWGGDCLMWAVNSWRRKPFSGWPKAKDNLPSGWGGRAGRRSTHSRPQGWFCRWVGRHEPRHLGNPCVQSQRLTVPTLGKIAYVTATQYHPWPNPIRICKQPRRKMKKSLTGVYSCFPDKNNWWVECLVTHLQALAPCGRAGTGQVSPKAKDQHFQVSEDSFICCDPCCPQVLFTMNRLYKNKWTNKTTGRWLALKHEVYAVLVS